MECSAVAVNSCPTIGEAGAIDSMAAAGVDVSEIDTSASETTAIELKTGSDQGERT